LDVARRVLTRFTASAARQAEAIDAAAESNDRDAIGRAAHFLKGMAANVGATTVARLAGEIETKTLAGNPSDNLRIQLSAAIERAVAASTAWLNSPELQSTAAE
jgi:HPt (histidine-containing phosphotransfer) domain-containing protein